MKLGLGTVQFGLAYGISNVAGQAQADEVRRILERAAVAGIFHLDTAPLYGESERRLGECLPQTGEFHITTKTPQFNDTRSLTVTCGDLRKVFMPRSTG